MYNSEQTKGTEYALTKADLKALKTCNRICVRYVEAGHIGEYSGLKAEEEISRIECIKEKDDKNPWEQHLDIPVCTRLQLYSGGNDRRICKAFELIYLYQWEQDSHIKTVVDLLKEGDRLCFWYSAGSGNNDLCKDAALHHDRLFLIVMRGEKRLTFMLESAVSLDNSARMVQTRARKEGEV